jgi:hypothetical protein
VNDATIAETQVINNEIAEYLPEMQWVVEKITGDLHQQAEFFERHEHLPVWTAFMKADADLLKQAWQQFCLNPTLMSHP